MIRAILIFTGLCDQLLIRNCNIVVALQKSEVCEVWVKCNSTEDLFTDIELAINKGMLLEEVAFLTGLRIKGYAINREVIETNRSSKESVEGEIKFEFYTPISKWIESLNLKKISIDVKNRKAIAILKTPVKIEQLFDLGLRLLKPKRVPP